MQVGGKNWSIAIHYIMSNNRRVGGLYAVDVVDIVDVVHQRGKSKSKCTRRVLQQWEGRKDGREGDAAGQWNAACLSTPHDGDHLVSKRSFLRTTCT